MGVSKYERHTDGKYEQNEIKRNKRLTYFKQNCPIFRFAIMGVSPGKKKTGHNNKAQEGGTPRKVGWGCAARFPKPLPCS